MFPQKSVSKGVFTRTARVNCDEALQMQIAAEGKQIATARRVSVWEKPTERSKNSETYRVLTPRYEKRTGLRAVWLRKNESHHLVL